MSKIKAKDVNVFYGDKQALFNVSIDIEEKQTTALIGPSGCGKSTLLNIIAGLELRTKVGMVFQKPNPFPKSIYDNVAYGPRIHGLAKNKAELDQIVETSLQRAGIWGEIKDRLSSSGTGLSGGQQQRLCIARAIAVKPEVILMDEPCSALDPIATATIEELMNELSKDFTIIIVTHNMQQAARISKKTAFFHLGNIIEYNTTETIFTNPTEEKTQDYITGRFG